VYRSVFLSVFLPEHNAGVGGVVKCNIEATGAIIAVLFPVFPQSVHWGTGKRVISKPLPAADRASRGFRQLDGDERDSEQGHEQP